MYLFSPIYRLSIPRKTIKPVAVGGIAGGVKFMHRGIFFKLAVDNNSIYGGDVWAMKTALHERKGLLNVMVKYSSSSLVE